MTKKHEIVTNQIGTYHESICQSQKNCVRSKIVSFCARNEPISNESGGEESFCDSGLGP